VASYLDDFFNYVAQQALVADGQNGYITVTAAMTVTPPANDQSDVPAVPSPVTVGYAGLFYTGSNVAGTPAPGGGEHGVLFNPAQLSGPLTVNQLTYGGFDDIGGVPGGQTAVAVNTSVEFGSMTITAPRPLQAGSTYRVEISLGGSTLSFVPLIDSANNVLLGNDGPFLITVSLSLPFVVPGS
jgi:hypothetical protein